MPAADPKGGFRRIASQPIVLIAAYYLILLAVGLSLSRFAPEVLSSGPPDVGRSGADLRDLMNASPPVASGTAVHDAIVAMIAGILLMIPVAALYFISRRTKGYAQSLMHTLLVLPVVVAGVVILVKTSIALAFSLGGIVGAIAFRNRLEDTKDAVHVFVAISIGLACGVQGTNIAFALSFLYTLINLVLWAGDIGRTPPGLIGPGAEARVEGLRAAPVAAGNDSDQALLSRIDTLLLKSMSPDQLEAVVARADKRRRRIAEELTDAPEPSKGKRWVRVKIFAAANDRDGKAADPEPALEKMMKKYTLEGAMSENGHDVRVYHGKIKKNRQAALLAGDLQSELGDAVGRIEVVDG